MSIDQITIGELISWGRDLAVAGTVITMGWKVRGAWEVVHTFITRVGKHMDKVETALERMANVEIPPVRRFR